MILLRLKNLFYLYANSITVDLIIFFLNIVFKNIFMCIKYNNLPYKSKV